MWQASWPTVYPNGSSGIGDHGNWTPLQTKFIPFLGQGRSETVAFEWAPRLGEQTCIAIAIFPQVGKGRFDNSRSQENVFIFDSEGASHEPVAIAAAVLGPFTVWRCAKLGVFELGERAVPQPAGN